MTRIDAVVLESRDPARAEAFYAAAFELGSRVRVRAAGESGEGFRGFTLSLGAAQPADVDLILGSAVEAGGRLLRPAKRSLWGYSGFVEAPDGVIWQVATAAKRSTTPASRTVQGIVLLLGVQDVAASRAFYVAQGLPVRKSVGAWVEFATEGIELSLLKRAVVARNAGVAPAGSGPHGLSILGDAGELVDPDGFGWEAVA